MTFLLDKDAKLDSTDVVEGVNVGETDCDPSIHLTKLLASPSQHEINPINNNRRCTLWQYSGTTNAFRDQANFIPTTSLITFHSRKPLMSYSSV